MQDIKAYLKSYIPALKYAEKCFRELDEAEDVWIRSPKMDGMPRTASPHGLEDQVARVEAVRARARRSREKVLDMLEDIETRIEALPDMNQRIVIKLRYLYGMQWAEISNETNWSLRAVYYIHGKALAEMRRQG